jgi:signal transduction histidine kinase
MSRYRMFQTLTFEDRARENQYQRERAKQSSEFLNSIWLPAMAFIALLLVRDMFLGLDSSAAIYGSLLRGFLLILTIVLYFYGRIQRTQTSRIFHSAVKLWVAIVTMVIIAVAASQSLESEARYFRALLGYLVVLGLFGTNFRDRVASLYFILIIGWIIISCLFYSVAVTNLEDFVSGQVTFVGMIIVVLSFNRALERAERKAFQTNVKLADANDELRRASAEKSNFLISLSHDLRQPLTGLVGYLDLTKMHAQKLNDPQLNTYLDGALRGSNLINLNLTKVLELSRIQDERFTPQQESVRVEEILKNVCGLLETKAIAENIHLKLVLPATEDQWVKTDPFILSQVLQNLVANALQYRRVGETKSWVLVSCVRRNAQILKITIADNGIGIPAQYHAKIFEPHFQIQNRSRSVDKGLGLGLAFVGQSITRLKDHRLSLSSNGRTYSKFNIYIPTSSEPHPVRSMANRDLNEANTFVTTSKFKYANVALFEDDKNIRLLFQNIAKNLNFQLLVFESIDELTDNDLGKLRKSSNSLLIISDYRLPRKNNGCETISKLRLLLEIEVPALIITGDLQFSQASLPLNTALLMKPFGLTQLIQAI